MAKARFHRRYWSTLSRRNYRTVAAGLGRACLILAVLMLVGGLAMACAGGEESTPTQGATVGPEGVLAPCVALNGLTAYRYSVQLELASPKPTEGGAEPTEGAAEPTATPTTTFTRPYTGDFAFDYRIDADFVAPDRTQALITSGGSELPMIIIGQDSWVHLGDAGWRPPEYPTPLPYQPADVCQAVFPELDLSAFEPQEEDANDVATLRYTLSQVPAGQALAKIFGPESDMALLISKLDADVWLAKKDGWPVRMDISAVGVYGDGRELRAHLLIDIKDANSGDIKVEPPA
jgi:hypothetical protein